MENYGRMTAKFESFCVSKNYEYPNFDEKSVLHFVIQLDSEKATFATMSPDTGRENDRKTEI